MPQAIPYSARFTRPDWLIRGALNTIEMPIEHDGSLVAPASGTVTVFDGGNAEIVSAGVVTITDSIAEYEIAAAVLPATLELNNTWREVWSLVMPDRATPYSFYRDAALVLRHLHPTLTWTDLERKHAEILDWYNGDRTKIQGFIDDAWYTIEAILIGQGRLPYRILSPWSVRDWHMNLTLGNMFTDAAASTSTDGKYAKLAAEYFKAADKAFSQLVLKYDYGNDTTMTDELEAGEAAVYLCSPGWVR